LFVKPPSLAVKLCILGGVSLPIYYISFRWDHLLPPPPWAPGWYQVEVFLLFILYCLALLLVWRSTVPARAALLVLFAFTVLFRLPLLPTEPRVSTDLYRYLWDGRVQVAGINPYRYAPGAKALRSLRDDAVYRWINRKEFPTVYPAGAQLVFWGAARLGLTTPARFKALLLLADLGSLVLLLLLLDHYKVNRLRSLLYAWNPLTVYESAHAGHLEPLVVFCVLAALLAFAKRRVNFSFVSLALAASLKLYPALLTAVLARGRAVRCVLIFTIVLMSTYAPYLTAGEKLSGFLPRYFSDPDEITNLGLPSLLFYLLPPAQAGWVLRLIVLAVAVWMFVRRKDDSAEHPYAPLNQVYLLVSVHTLLLYPALYPWYLSWLMPLLCFFPSPGWLYFSCASAFVYLPWPTPTWALWLEYAPLYVLLGVEITVARQRLE
jgi:hypothetical protein